MDAKSQRKTEGSCLSLLTKRTPRCYPWRASAPDLTPLLASIFFLLQMLAQFSKTSYASSYARTTTSWTHCWASATLDLCLVNKFFWNTNWFDIASKAKWKASFLWTLMSRKMKSESTPSSTFAATLNTPWKISSSKATSGSASSKSSLVTTVSSIFNSQRLTWLSSRSASRSRWD